MHNFHSDMSFSEQHLKDIIEILNGISGNPFLTIDIASAEKDLKEATDIILTVKLNTVQEIVCDLAVRTRRKEYFWGESHSDWTVRCFRGSGTETELNKLKKGHARLYFMSWSLDNTSKIGGWVLIDIKKVRDIGILDSPDSIRSNGDSRDTKFACYSLGRLRDAGCILAESFLM